MSELDVHIVKLEPMRVVSVHGFGKNPEHKALNKLIAWAKPKGLLDNLEKQRIFGFDNPSPTPGSPNYGYEVWIAVDADMEPETEIKLKDFSGGLYAVTRCEVQGNVYEVIPETWKRLVAWREDSQYKHAYHQWMEKHLGPIPAADEFILELYLPIAE